MSYIKVIYNNRDGSADREEFLKVTLTNSLPKNERRIMAVVDRFYRQRRNPDILSATLVDRRTIAAPSLPAAYGRSSIVTVKPR